MQQFLRKCWLNLFRQWQRGFPEPVQIWCTAGEPTLRFGQIITTGTMMKYFVTRIRMNSAVLP